MQLFVHSMFCLLVYQKTAKRNKEKHTLLNTQMQVPPTPENTGGYFQENTINYVQFDSIF